MKYVWRLFLTIQQAGVAIESVDENGIVAPSSLQAAAQPIIDAFDDSDVAHIAWENLRSRANAIVGINSDKNVSFKLFRAIIGIVLDELNLHAGKHNAILDAIDNGTTLAQVKNNIAAIPNYPTRTKQELITAMENKLNSGVVD